MALLAAILWQCKIIKLSTYKSRENEVSVKTIPTQR